MPHSFNLRFIIALFLANCSRFCLQACALLLAVLTAQTAASADTAKPILISQPTSTRAIALDALGFTLEPFTAKSLSYFYGSDKSTRVMLFALNLSLQSGEDASALTADAEDSTTRTITADQAVEA